ncbi:hypothetical protein BDM02DRAFT_3193292 [Thelephora ganbajun]|uniref:Uncharacterized protein n=1 Tax=Thelephora ganbajun TaxID=370292 RepID=A0ACB6YZ04_THEGA|nr:hypothetical protein BDM02DRAFT_3193292 [Thelephora ganbajun]
MKKNSFSSPNAYLSCLSVLLKDRAAIELTLITEDARQRKADCQEAKRRRISSIEHLEVVPEVKEPMDIDPEDNGQPTVSTTPIDVPSPSANAPGPSTSRYGHIRRSLPHMPSFKMQKQQREEAEIAEAERRRGIPSPMPPSSPTPPVELERFRTEEDEFRCFRIYCKCPISELSNTPLPDHNDFTESGEIRRARPENVASGLRMPVAFVAGLSSLIGLFVNTTIALLIQWFCSGTGQKSTADIQRLIDNVILHEDFKAEDLQGVNLARELKKLDTFESSLEDQGWKKGSVKISVPCPKKKVTESKAVEFKIKGLLYRDLTTVIKNACQDEVTMDSFHVTPFKEMWKPSDNASPIQLYGEAYTSDEMISAYEEVCQATLAQTLTGTNEDSYSPTKRILVFKVPVLTVFQRVGLQDKQPLQTGSERFLQRCPERRGIRPKVSDGCPGDK